MPPSLAGCPRRWTVTTLGVLTLACAGGQSAYRPAARTRKLVYTDPVGTGWRLMRNAERSTDQRLVLDLWAPEGGVAGRGVVIALGSGGSGAVWDAVEEGKPKVMAQGYTTWPLSAMAREDAQPGWVKGGFFMLGQGTAVNLTGPVASVALKWSGLAGRRGAVPLEVPALQVLPPTGNRLESVPCIAGALEVVDVLP